MALASLVAWNGLFASIFTLIIGIIYIKVKMVNLNWKLEWQDCDFTNKGPYEPWIDCNMMWATVFGIVGVAFWAPVSFGLAGLYLQRPPLLKADHFPKTFSQYGGLMIVQASYANFGYCGKLGVVCGAYSVFVALLCFAASLLGLDEEGQQKSLLRLPGFGRRRLADGDSTASSEE
eukprot:TRINITY_DN74501_c0_g1_i1.p2 TRINITY_DN74501_c0_g1~~TRINITY_DN74501_c0_g1_i1.p2  ORF type:complete len:184 (+),score=49.37 TRINITY_DN74501_c0_g1_i1:27-554(+)